MLHDIYQNIPLYIDPIAFSIGSFSVRWYAISYIIGFGVVYAVSSWRLKHDEVNSILQISKKNSKIQNTKYGMQNILLDYLLTAFFSALIGGRIGFALFYDTKYFFEHPLAIISPFNQEGVLVGIFGMSYHGALLGIIIGSWIFLKIRKVNFLAWADFIIPAATLGYFFGRIGNFLNGELYGRITEYFWGMHFVYNQNSLRHPSQLYEAFLEGLLLFLILWKMRNRKFKAGVLFATYLIGYGSLRIFVEQFREPDAQVGLLVFHLTMGQILSLFMILFGVILLVFKNRK